MRTKVDHDELKFSRNYLDRNVRILGFNHIKEMKYMYTYLIIYIKDYKI